MVGFALPDSFLSGSRLGRRTANSCRQLARFPRGGITEGAVSENVSAILSGFTGPLLHFLGYGCLGLLVWAVLRLASEEEKARQIGHISLLTLGICLSVAAVDELLQLWLPGRQPSLADIGYDMLGAAAAAAGLALFFFCLQKFPRVFNRETISYVVFRRPDHRGQYRHLSGGLYRPGYPQPD